MLKISTSTLCRIHRRVRRMRKHSRPVGPQPISEERSGPEPWDHRRRNTSESRKQQRAGAVPDVQYTPEQEEYNFPPLDMMRPGPGADAFRDWVDRSRPPTPRPSDWPTDWPGIGHGVNPAGMGIPLGPPLTGGPPMQP